MAFVGDDDDSNDDDTDGVRSLALIPVGPGAQPAGARLADAVYFSADFTVKPVALFGGQFLISVLASSTTIDVHAIAVQTGKIVGTAVIGKLKDTPKQQFGLQLCSLSDQRRYSSPAATPTLFLSYYLVQRREIRPR